MENLNAPHELDRLKTKVLQQLQALQGAPGVQMMEVRAGRVFYTAIVCAAQQYFSSNHHQNGDLSSLVL